MMVGLFTALVASDLDRGRKASKRAPVGLRVGDPRTSSPDFRLCRSSTALRLDVGVPGEAAGGVPAEEADTVDEDAATVPA